MSIESGEASGFIRIVRRGIIVYMRQVVHLSEPATSPELEERRTAMADVLRPFRGRYVARRDGRVLVDADSSHEIVDWLRQNHIEGAAVFRVPVDPSVDSGSHGV